MNDKIFWEKRGINSPYKTYYISFEAFVFLCVLIYL